MIAKDCSRARSGSMRSKARVRLRVLTTAIVVAAVGVSAALAAPAMAVAGSPKPASKRTPRQAHARRDAGRHEKRSGQGGEQKLSASIVLKLTPPTPKLPQTNQINLFVPQRFHDAGAKMPHCEKALLQEKGPKACPKRSIVGGGTSIGYTILGGEYVIEHLTLTMLNGPHASLLTFVEGKSPVEIEEIVEGVITAPKGYGEEMSFTIPHGLLEPLPGAPGWLQTLNAHLSGKAGWLRTTSCPPHPWHLKAELGYVDGEGISVETELGCV